MVELVITFESYRGRQEDRTHCVEDTRIDLSTLAIQSVDLSSLSKCRKIELLDLSDNLLSDVDLSALAENCSLSVLRLHTNRLETIDLWPLLQCEGLRVVNLSENRLTEIDVTPVARVELLSMDRRTTAILDPILKFLQFRGGLIPSWYLVPQRPPISSDFPRMVWRKYETVAANIGWNTLKSQLVYILETIPEELWFPAQIGLLEGFGISELGGIDCDPRQILAPVDSNLDFQAAKNEIYNHCVNLLEEQIANGGPTAFLSVEGMKNGRASKLIPALLEQRQKEIEETVIPIFGRKAFLYHLWMTAYGLELLPAMRMGMDTTLGGLSSIINSLDRIGLTLNTQDVEEEPEFTTSPVSDSMRDQILRVASSASKLPDVVRRERWPNIE
ncbi:MAG: hypothetical protein RTU92_06045 [Candidatus Thorarchaeota archaeon]